MKTSQRDKNRKVAYRKPTFFQRHWGIQKGKLSIVWYDCWSEKFCLEVGYGNKLIINL